MRTYYADIEDRVKGRDFIYTMYADSDEEAIKKFKRVYGNRVEMISLVGSNSKICIYEKPELFGRTEVEKLTSYKDLLKAYILHVYKEEGATFLENGYIDRYTLSPRQREELTQLKRELEQERNLR